MRGWSLAFSDRSLSCLCEGETDANGGTVWELLCDGALACDIAGVSASDEACIVEGGDEDEGVGHWIRATSCVVIGQWILGA